MESHVSTSGKGVSVRSHQIQKDTNSPTLSGSFKVENSKKDRASAYIKAQ
jgi:hypothetical protein